MSQGGDDSGLVSLLWGLWIYLGVCWWHEHLSLMSQSKEKPRTDSFSSSMGEKIRPLKGSSVSSNLEALASGILQRSGGISIKDFLGEMLAAYESIVTAFDAGDRSTLLKLVSPEVYHTFSDAIAAREARHEITETLFSRIEPPEILSGFIDEPDVEVSIRFVAESYKLSRNASGQLVDRRPDRRHSIDVWTFRYGSSSPTGEWRLVATGGGVE
jgi:predicted lipid-binding transport protein (Tim44 family)